MITRLWYINDDGKKVIDTGKPERNRKFRMEARGLLHADKIDYMAFRHAMQLLAELDEEALPEEYQPVIDASIKVLGEDGFLTYLALEEKAFREIYGDLA